MMKRLVLKRFVPFLCVISLSILFTERTCIYAHEIPGVTEESIKVGAILDQTGPAAIVSVPATQAIQSYFRHLNDQGGINGRKIKLLVEDDRYTIPMALSAFKKLVFKDKVFILMGPTSSSALTALSRSIHKEKIPLLSLISPEITVKPFKRYMFIIQDIYPGQMNVLIDYILKDLNPKEPRIGLVYPDNEAGKVDLESALKRLKSYNLAPVSKQVLNTEAIDASSQVMNLKRDKVNHIILPGSTPAFVLLRDLKKYGLHVPVFGSYSLCSEEVIELVGDAAKQFFAVNAANSWYDKGPGPAKMREITLRYHPGTEKPYRGKVYTLAWVLAMMTAEGLKRTGPDLNREAFIDAMETIRNFDTGGLTGPINYSSTSHKGGNTWRIFRADPSTRKFIPLTEWRKSD
ncbi:MAG: ABC transporter substrate-binding protein [Thermodesulfobacteriota bacterium]|nr:ABC transporter substrate-binding protein [Thermodesulfobacteriota bacterium]